MSKAKNTAMAKPHAARALSKPKPVRTSPKPENERADDVAAPGFSEGDPKALSHHPAREAAIGAAAKQSRAKADDRGTGRQGLIKGEAGQPKRGMGKGRKGADAAEAKPKVSADLPDALREIAADDRVTVRRDGVPNPDGKVVVYWMQRAERAFENPALDVAVRVANALGLPVVVYFAGISNFPGANLRHYAFLNEGLRDVSEDLGARNCTFVLRNAPKEDHLTLFREVQAAFVIGDENPMRVPESWRVRIAKDIRVPFWTVDADVIVPSGRFDKAQYAAYTIRNRLWKMVPEYAKASENPKAKHAWQKPSGFHEDDVQKDMTAVWKDLDRSVGAAPELRGGAHAAQARLKHFVTKLLPGYAHNRNHPDLDATSMLSPYLHYGHISPVTIYLAIEAAVEKDSSLRESADSFLDELVTWRELCVNFVKYNPHYDDPECAEAWARKTVAAHAHDAREVIYTLGQLERAETYDELWNAAQRQMVRHGWMHNFMRMYWAKKVLEWSPDNATAMKHLIHMNDKYFLDGRDPGGYAGIAWAIYGKFDRPWGERKIFGKIRYMSAASSGKKFNSKAYIAQHPPLNGGDALKSTYSEKAHKPERSRAHRAKGQFGG